MKGREEGRAEMSELIAAKMIRLGKSFEEITALTDIPLQKLEILANSLNT